MCTLRVPPLSKNPRSRQIPRSHGLDGLRLTASSSTSCAANNVPLFEFDSVGDMELPAGCELVGVELVEDAVSLPSFRHPRRCAYVLGPERGNLSDAMLARCRHVVKIPTKFCINVGVAGAIVMYDRQLSLGRFAERPVAAGGNMSPLPPPVHGRPVLRTVGRRGGSET